MKSCLNGHYSSSQISSLLLRIKGDTILCTVSHHLFDLLHVTLDVY